MPTELDTRRIYVASSWRNRLQPAVVGRLRLAGFDVYDFRNPEDGDNGFHWSEIDPNWEGWSAQRYAELIDHPVAVDGFKKDLAAMEWADTFVLIMPCGRSAHLELGWAVGQGKRTAILLRDEGFKPELMYRMVDYLATGLSGLLGWLGIPEDTDAD
jgi:hypothetical protein